jgi:hypothetical protein
MQRAQQPPLSQPDKQIAVKEVEMFYRGISMVRKYKSRFNKFDDFPASNLWFREI